MNQCLIAVQHSTNTVVVFICWCTQIWTEFKLATMLCILNSKCDGVVIGVEVPWETIPLFCQVDDNIGKGVGVSVKRWLFENLLDEWSK